MEERDKGGIYLPDDAARRQHFRFVPKTPPDDQSIVQTEEGLSSRTNEAEKKKAEIILDFLMIRFPQKPTGDTFYEAENFQRSFYGWWQSHATMRIDPFGTNAIIATITHEDLEDVAFGKFRKAKIKRHGLIGSQDRQEQHQTEGELFYWKRVLAVLEVIRLQGDPDSQKPQIPTSKEPVLLHRLTS